MKQELERLCALNPESLGAATPQDFLFKYIDISSVERGRIHWDQVRRYKFSEAPSRARRRVKKDDVLLCTVRPGLQAHARIPKEDDVPFVASTGFAALRPYNEEDSSFVFQQLFSNDVVAQLRSKEVGSSYPAVNESDVRRLSIFMPEPSQRKAIGKVLDTIDEAIAKTEAVITKLKQVRAGMLHDLLSCGLDEHGQLRDPIAQPEQFQDSPLGLIPREWGISSLRECCLDVVDCPHSTPHFEDVGILVARTMHIRDGQYDISASSRVSEKEYMQRISRIEPKHGDVIFTREAPVGEAFVVPEGMQICLGQRVMLLRPKEEELIGSYLVSQIYSGQVRKRIDSLTGGTTNPHLNVAEVRDFKIPLPLPDEQKRIVEVLGMHARSLAEEHLNLQKLLYIQKGLQDDLLTGRVRVPETIMEGAKNV